MPSLSQIKTYITLTVLPVVAGAVANWLIVHVHVLSTFHITRDSAASAVSQLGVFAVTAGLTWLSSHHVLKGTYEPASVLPRHAVSAPLTRSAGSVGSAGSAGSAVFMPTSTAPPVSPPPPAAS